MSSEYIRQLGFDAHGKVVFLDPANTNVEYHLLETPSLLDLVREVLPSIELTGDEQIVVEKDLGRVVGTTSLVETTDEDEIVYAKRIGRDSYSRFAKNRELTPCSSIVVVLRKRDDKYYLWTAMCGKMLPEDAYDKDSKFNATHALVYDEKLIQVETLTESRPF